MKNNQIKLLEALAAELKKKKPNKAEAQATLRAAKILDKNNNFTKNYSNLRRVTSLVK